MATTPPTATDSLVQVKEDPDSLALRARLAAAEEKLAAAAEAMNATQKLLVQALTAPQAAPAAEPLADAELWRWFALAALDGGPPLGWSASEYATQAADKMLAEYRKRYPVG